MAANRERSLILSLCTILLSAGVALGASAAGPQAIAVGAQGLPTSQAEDDTWRLTDLEELVGRSALAVWGQVTRADSFWRSDEHGRHVYTTVEISPLGEAIGHLAEATLVFEVVGGTVDGLTESVSNVPEFAAGEEVVVFVGGSPYRPVAGRDGKIDVYDGKVYRGRELPVEVFLQGLNLIAAGESPEALWESASPRLKVLAGPIIGSIKPDRASAGTDAIVTITGIGFGATQDTGRVEFFYDRNEPRLPATVILWSDSKIVCTVPTGEVGGRKVTASSGPVTVRTSTGTSNGFIFRVTFGYGLAKWPGENPVVKYYVNENTSDCTGEGAAVQRAANTWNGAGAKFAFEYAGSHSATEASRDNRNELMWGSVDAVATTTTWSLAGEVLECDTVFNDDFVWNASTTASISKMDVESVALHEMGHWLKLRDLYGTVLDDDVYDIGKVMYGRGEEGDVLRVLHDDDRAGIQWIYPDLPAVLICGAVTDARWLADIQAKLTDTGQFAKVDTLNVGSVTPTLATLQDYRAVMVFSDADYADPTALGNVMASYADSGHGVVCALSEVAGSSTKMQGRWEKDVYYAIPRSGRYGGSRVTMGTVYDWTHPIMQGVTSFNGGTNSYRTYANSVTPGAFRVADWLDGRPLVVTKVVGKSRRVDLAFFPVSSDRGSDFWDASTDGARLMANALTWAADPSPADIVLTFEGISKDYQLEIPEGYGDLNWYHWFYIMDVVRYQYRDSGYVRGCISPGYVAYSAWEDPVEFSSKQPFDFVGAYMTGAWRDGLKIDINGFRGGVLLYSRTFILNSTYPTWVQLDYAGVDHVMLDSYGGVENPAYTGSGEHFVIDNVTIRRP